MTSLGFLTFSSLKLHRFGQSLNTNPKPKVLNTLCLTHASSQTHCFTHARLSHLTQLKLMPHGLWISESHNFFFFLLTLTASEFQIYRTFFFSHPHGISVSILPSVLYSLLLDVIRYWFFSFDFDFDYLILFLSFDHFLVLFFFLFISLGFISESLFMCLTLSQVLHSVTSLLSGNFYQLLVYNSILVYLWFCVCCGFDLQSIIVAKYSLQSIILLFVYVVLMNLFVDKMVVAIVLMNLFVNKMVSL